MKAWDRSREKKMPKRVGANTHPCFTPLFMGKESEVDPSYRTVPFISVWKEIIMLRSFREQSIFPRSSNRPFLLTRSKALVRLMNIM